MTAPTSAAKERLDLIIVERGLVDSREKARAVILAGSVTVNGNRVDKAGMRVARDARITITRSPRPFASRGGTKLAAALTQFKADVSGLTILDVGASTGGFTDCLLLSGAAVVYALDVGYGQLAWGLRGDDRVVVMERTNIRNVTRGDFAGEIDGAVIDVSFISLTLVLPVVYKIVKPAGFVIALVKPQFEVGKGEVGKGGVVRDPEKHREVIRRVAECAAGLGFSIGGTIESPITGPKGNKEFFVYLTKGVVP
jgi:23S rRNA (cytidine1920-2'-O)/16S rRNA (cytidine1409-2'-O)-methyltransferase